ncbi:MAG: hypothetical protein J4432_04295 [DPANN group archaeon]|nr:hypothetical protein [DPANN group archaeon]
MWAAKDAIPKVNELIADQQKPEKRYDTYASTRVMHLQNALSILKNTSDLEEGAKQRALQNAVNHIQRFQEIGRKPAAVRKLANAAINDILTDETMAPVAVTPDGQTKIERYDNPPQRDLADWGL